MFSDDSQALVDMSLSLRCTSKVLKVYRWVIGSLGQLRPEGATKKSRTQSCSSLLLTGWGFRPKAEGPTCWVLVAPSREDSPCLAVGLRLGE